MVEPPTCETRTVFRMVVVYFHPSLIYVCHLIVLCQLWTTDAFSSPLSLRNFVAFSFLRTNFLQQQVAQVLHTLHFRHLIWEGAVILGKAKPFVVVMPPRWRLLIIQTYFSIHHIHHYLKLGGGDDKMTTNETEGAARRCKIIMCVCRKCTGRQQGIH